MDNREQMTLNQRLELAGVTTIRETDKKGNQAVSLEYNGKRMTRPIGGKAIEDIYRVLGVNI